MTLLMVVNFAGGVGLFLLGMKLMSDGLRVAAGNALRSILARWTTNYARATATGFLITALMQSSTAVIFATIGFVNAGFLNLFQAVSVIIGSAVGTTMTSWLVVVVGVDFNIRALALPLIAIGMFLRMVVPGERRGPAGEALAGFGLFLLGLDVLREMFGGIEDTLLPEQTGVTGYAGLALYLVAGLGLTLLTQSSSAAVAVTLTAVAGGVIPLAAGAAVVIGANIGTTSTSMFASIGATTLARRAATGHVIFNLSTGMAAFLALPLILKLVALLIPEPTATAMPALSLAVFHTLIQTAGLLAFWPLIGGLVHWLETRIRVHEDDQIRPHYLDSTVVGVPSLAIDALYHELLRVIERARSSVKLALSAEGGDGMRTLEHDRQVIERLVLAVGEFTRQVQNTELPRTIAGALPAGLRVTQYCTEMNEMAREVLALQPRLAPVSHSQLQQKLNIFKQEAVGVLQSTQHGDAAHANTSSAEALEALQNTYQNLKETLLQAAAEGKLPLEQMALQLEEISHIRRALEQAVKADRYLQQIAAAITPP